MFELNDIKDYWVLVTVNEEQDDIRIIKQSEDFKAEEDFSIDDYTIEYSNVHWCDAEDNKPGIYKLKLEPVFTEVDEGDDEAAEFDHMKVVSQELVFEI